MCFARSARLKRGEVFPPTSLRRLSDTEEMTEVVSLFLNKTEGITPQHMAVQFGYFSRLQAWGLVLIPFLFFVLGQAIGPVLCRTALPIVNTASARVHLGGATGMPRPRQSGDLLRSKSLEQNGPG